MFFRAQLSSFDLPEEYKYLTYMLGDRTVVRTNVKDMDEFQEWLTKLASKSNTNWSVQHSTGFTNPKSKSRSKKYSCHHGSRYLTGKRKLDTK